MPTIQELKDEQSQWASCAEVAEIVGLKLAYLRKLVAAKRFRRTRLGKSGRIEIHADAIEAFLRQRENNAFETASRDTEQGA